MRPFDIAIRAFASAAVISTGFAATAADFPDPVTDTYVIENFTFHTAR